MQSSLHVALAVVSLLTVTHLEFNWCFSYPLVVFVFCSTVLTYNFIKYATTARSYYYVKGTRQKSIRTLSYICGFVCVLCGFYLPFSTLWLALGLGMISFLYVLPLPSTFQGFRNVKHLKSVIVAVVWASVAAILPVVTYDAQLDSNHLIFWFVLFFWTLATLIPFEIRDMKWDDPNMGTLPHSIGIRGTKVVGYFLVLIVFFLESWIHGWVWTSMVGTALLCLVILWMLSATKVNQSTYYASFWVEALPFLWMFIKLFERKLGL